MEQPGTCVFMVLWGIFNVFNVFSLFKVFEVFIVLRGAQSFRGDQSIQGVWVAHIK
jgi:hypothetical protein